MTSRSQITLDPELRQRARKRAESLGISFSEYVRRVLASDLGESPPRVDPSEVFDLGSSGGTDVARDKDALVAEALTAARTRAHTRE